MALAFFVSAGVGDASATTRAEVFKALDIDQLRADYVILVDTSGSMQEGNWYGKVKKALKPFVRALAPADFLSLISFDTEPEIDFSGKVGKNPARALKQLPATATGAKTDIGAAIEMAIDELSRPDAAEVAVITFFTDGRQDAPPGSKYPTTSGPAWAALRKKASRLDAKELRAYAIGLGQGTDAALLKKVFPSAVVIALPPDQLRAYLERVKEQARIAKAQSLLRPDMKRGVMVEWPASLHRIDFAEKQTRVKVTLRSQTESLPLKVTGLAVRVSGFDFKVDGLPESVALAPGEEKTISVTITWSYANPFHLPKGVSESATLTVAGKVSTPWDDVLTSDLDLDYKGTVQNEGGSIRAVGKVGWGWGIWAAIAVVVVGAVTFAVVKWRTRNPRLSGVVTVTTASPQSAAYKLTLRRRRQVPFGRGEKDLSQLQGKGSVRGETRVVSKPSRGKRPVQKRVKVLVIKYGTDGSPSRETSCEWGATAQVAGLTFKWSST